MTDKKLEKLEKTLGKEVTGDMQALSAEALNAQIVISETNIKTVVDELEANEKYQEIKEQKKAAEAGLKGVRKFQNAMIQYALHLLEEKGK